MNRTRNCGEPIVIRRPISPLTHHTQPAAEPYRTEPPGLHSRALTPPPRPWPRINIWGRRTALLALSFAAQCAVSCCCCCCTYPSFRTAASAGLSGSVTRPRSQQRARSREYFNTRDYPEVTTYKEGGGIMPHSVCQLAENGAW